MTRRDDTLQPNEALRVSVDDGKYTIIQASAGGLRALRYGEEWRDLTGDGMVLALAQEIQNLRDVLESIRKPSPELTKAFMTGDSAKVVADFQSIARAALDGRFYGEPG